MYRVSLILALTAIVGCRNFRSSRPGDVPPSVPSEQPAKGEPDRPPGSIVESPPTVETRPVSPEDENAHKKVMAYVNGTPIYMDDIHELLVRADGLRIALHLVGCKLVEQAAAEHDLTLAEQELEAEHERALQRMFPNVPELSQRQRLFEQLLRRQKIPEKLWLMSVLRNVLLGKLVAE